MKKQVQTAVQEQPSTPTRAQEFLRANIGREWGAALSRAESAETYTATAYWQAEYRERTAKYKAQQSHLIEQARGILDRIGSGGTTEEDLTALKDTTKELAALHAERSVWDFRVVSPLRTIATKAKSLRDRCVEAAQNAERENPLHAGGLAREVAQLVQRLSVVRWEEQTGLLVIERADDSVAAGDTDAA